MKHSLLVALAITLLLAFPSVASESHRRDPNDAHGPLDIRRISHGHKGDLVWHKVVMRSSWGPQALRGADQIRFQFSTDGEDRFDEVNASVDLKDGELRAWVFPYVEGSDYAGVGPSERIRLTRPDRYSVKIFFKRSWVDKRNRYAWSVSSYYKRNGSRHCENTCRDYAPGASPNRLVHNL